MAGMSDKEREAFLFRKRMLERERRMQRLAAMSPEELEVLRERKRIQAHSYGRKRTRSQLDHNKAIVRRRRRELDEFTRRVATRSGLPFTADEDHVLLRDDLSTLEKALLIGRSYSSANTRRGILLQRDRRREDVS